MSAPIRVREAHESEWRHIGDLCVAAYRAGGHLGPDDPYTQTLADVGARAASAEVLVAERGGELVGTVTICPPGSPFAELCIDGESEFRFLAVRPTAWRTGVGEALVDACEDRAVARGQRAHVICVIDRNRGGHLFYERLGFTRAPERDWEPVPGVNLQAFTRAVPWAAAL